MGLICLVIFVFGRVDVDGIQDSWKGISPQQIVFLTLLFSFSLIVRIGKWAWQIREVGFVYQPLALVRSYIEGLLVGLITPLRVGELYRLAVLKVPNPPPTHLEDPIARTSLGAASLLLEKAYELVIITTMVSLGLYFSFGEKSLALMLGLLSLGMYAFGFFPITLPKTIMGWIPAGLRKRLVDPMFRARDDLSFTTRIGLLFLTLLAQMINLTGGAIIFNLFGEVSIATYILRMPAITLINLVPITVAGVGLRELGSMQVFGPVGFEESAAAAAATLLFVSIQLVPLFLLIPLYLLKALGYEKEHSEETL